MVVSSAKSYDRKKNTNSNISNLIDINELGKNRHLNRSFQTESSIKAVIYNEIFNDINRNPYFENWKNTESIRISLSLSTFEKNSDSHSLSNKFELNDMIAAYMYVGRKNGINLRVSMHDYTLGKAELIIEKKSFNPGLFYFILNSYDSEVIEKNNPYEKDTRKIKGNPYERATLKFIVEVRKVYEKFLKMQNRFHR